MAGRATTSSVLAPFLVRLTLSILILCRSPQFPPTFDIG
jgi:hypothetical protein